MELSVTQPATINVDAIRVVLPVQYGDEDIPNNFPLRKGDVWEATINIETGQIRNWPPMAGKEGPRTLEMKVTDMGCYYLLSGDKRVAAIESDYVPDCIPGEYGDYVKFEISANGKITNWDTDADEVAEAFFRDKE